MQLRANGPIIYTSYFNHPHSSHLLTDIRLQNCFFFKFSFEKSAGEGKITHCNKSMTFFFFEKLSTTNYLHFSFLNMSDYVFTWVIFEAPFFNTGQVDRVRLGVLSPPPSICPPERKRRTMFLKSAPSFHQLVSVRGSLTFPLYPHLPFFYSNG